MNGRTLSETDENRVEDRINRRGLRLSPKKSNQINGVFIPVSSIGKGRDWYCRLLNLPKI